MTVPLKKILVAAVVFAAQLYAQNAPAPASGTDPWSSLRFLIGTWEAKTQGGLAGAAGTGTYSFRLELRDHVLARYAATAGCSGPADFDCEHADLLYIYRESSGQSYRAIFFDNEGHVIHYDVSTPSAARAIFLSNPAQPGPQYRLSYELKGRTMTGKFEMRMPGRADFSTYLEWSGEKK